MELQQGSWDIGLSDDYGVFDVASENCHEFSPLNNAPSNWSTVDLDQPYSRESPSRPWVREYGKLNVKFPVGSLKGIVVYPHLMKYLIMWIKLLLYDLILSIHFYAGYYYYSPRDNIILKVM